MPPIGKKPPVINPFQQLPQELQIEFHRAVSASGQSALKGLLIMNGGAAVALLAFLGTVAGREGVPPEYVAAMQHDISPASFARSMGHHGKDDKPCSIVGRFVSLLAAE